MYSTPWIASEGIQVIDVTVDSMRTTYLLLLGIRLPY
jgi:hypothetical protein